MKNLLRSVMIAKGDTYESLAQKLGIARSTLSNKVNGRILFSQREMKQIMDMYELDPKQFIDIFFAK